MGRTRRKNGDVRHGLSWPSPRENKRTSKPGEMMKKKLNHTKTARRTEKERTNNNGSGEKNY